jgi:hypothetical protein
MIPNIFISSTISDLRYLRDGLCDAIAEIAYNPVMSEYGEVGYLYPGTAASACYRTVGQCQMVVLILGRKYGTVFHDGFSVTHREFLSAREAGIPTISFVESKVLSYKEVFDAGPDGDLWDQFSEMESPRKTFSLIDEVTSSPNYNGLLPFTTVADAKRLLKLQIADFVGLKLTETIAPVRTDVQEILAEIKTLRNQIAHSTTPNTTQETESRNFLVTMRFLLDDKYAEYRKFVETLVGDLDVAIPILIKAETFQKVLDQLKWRVEIQDDRDAFNAIWTKDDKLQRRSMRSGVHGWYAIFDDNRVLVNSALLDKFEKSQSALRARLRLDKG